MKRCVARADVTLPWTVNVEALLPTISSPGSGWVSASTGAVGATVMIASPHAGFPSLALSAVQAVKVMGPGCFRVNEPGSLAGTAAPAGLVVHTTFSLGSCLPAPSVTVALTDTSLATG